MPEDDGSDWFHLSFPFHGWQQISLKEKAPLLPTSLSKPCSRSHPSRKGIVCKVRTQDPENFDEEVKSLVTAWWLTSSSTIKAAPGREVSSGAVFLAPKGGAKAWTAPPPTAKNDRSKRFRSSTKILLLLLFLGRVIVDVSI